MVKAIPGRNSRVPITLLGSSDFSARLAAELGLPFAFAAHFSPEMLMHSTHLYRSLFRPSETLKQPWLMVAVPVIAAETDAAARRLFTTPQQRFLRLIRNQPVELLAPVDSLDSIDPPWTAFEQAAVESRLSAAIVGSDETVKSGLTKLVTETGANEIIVVTDTWDHEARLDSYHRVAKIASSIEIRASAEPATIAR
jgi:luciferase family oxidoreductase group 1